MSTLFLLLTPLIAFAVTAGFMPLVNALAVRTGFVDAPSARKIHSRPVPLLGGVAVYGGVVLSLICFADLDRRVVMMMVASLIVMLIGVVDDRLDISSRYRLILQLAVATGLAASGVRFHFFPWPVLDGLLTVLWIVGVINAMNCLDCADGAAGATCLVVFAAIAAVAAAGGRMFIAQAALAGIGAMIGFLLFNAPPARVFLGDAGSTFLGLMLAALAILAQPAPREPFQLPLAPFFLLIPVLDILWVHYRRARAGITSFRDLMAFTGKDHLPHRLLACGLSPRAVFGALATLSLATAGGALLLASGQAVAGALVFATLAFAGKSLETRGKVVIREDGVAVFAVTPAPAPTAAVPPHPAPAPAD